LNCLLSSAKPAFNPEVEGAAAGLARRGPGGPAAFAAFPGLFFIGPSNSIMMWLLSPVFRESLLEIDSSLPPVTSPADFPGLTGGDEEAGAEAMSGGEAGAGAAAGGAPSFPVFLAVSMPAQPMTIMKIKAMMITENLFKCMCDSFLVKAF